MRIEVAALALVLVGCGGSSSAPANRSGSTPPSGYGPGPNAPVGQPGYGGAYPPPGGYPQQGGYPPPGGYPQQAGYPPQGAYPQQPPYPPQGGNAQQGGYPQQGGYTPQGGYPQQGGYPPRGGTPQQGGATQLPPYAPAPSGPASPPPAHVPAPAPGPTAPLSPALLGVPAWRAETVTLLGELIARLTPAFQAKVAGIPLVFEDSPSEVNAFAGCDERGKSFMATTNGMLMAVDAITQTRATDELFGTRTYEAYASQVVPQMVRSETFVPSLPPNLIPVQHVADPRRLSRAHDLFDEVMGFTFAHELAHHYLGHTGCANGDSGSVFSPAGLGRLASGAYSGLNQANEVFADNYGVVNLLDTGRARAPRYRWTEGGGLLLLDFFGRLAGAAGQRPISVGAFFRTHPAPALRVPIVTAVARTWHTQNGP